jgi:Mn2+/Fe2+ NRAMP family transporter
LLFSAGLFNASFFAACILPLSTVYSVCEGLGFEAGVNKRFSEAPVFYWLYTFLIVVGAAVILIPGFDLVKMILFSQVINGVLLPVILIFMTLLINKRSIMKEWTNSRFYNIISWTSVALMIGLTLALMAISIQVAGPKWRRAVPCEGLVDVFARIHLANHGAIVLEHAGAADLHGGRKLAAIE